jgi:hypothetical protein
LKAMGPVTEILREPGHPPLARSMPVVKNADTVVPAAPNSLAHGGRTGAVVVITPSALSRSSGDRPLGSASLTGSPPATEISDAGRRRWEVQKAL